MSSDGTTIGILALAGAAGLVGGVTVGVALGVILLGVSGGPSRSRCGNRFPGAADDGL